MKCAKCKINERVSSSYCRSCKNEMDLKSYHKNKEKRRTYQINYFNNNPEKKDKQVIQTKEWLKNNPSYMNEWIKNKRNTDPSFKLNHYLSSRLHSALKGFTKSNTLTSYLGCSLLHLQQHIEKQFKDNMNWDNYGEWHIDHIQPVSSFDLTDENQIYKCWHYTNLQPLWALDNLKKGKKQL